MEKCRNICYFPSLLHIFNSFNRHLHTSLQCPLRQSLWRKLYIFFSFLEVLDFIFSPEIIDIFNNNSYFQQWHNLAKIVPLLILRTFFDLFSHKVSRLSHWELLELFVRPLKSPLCSLKYLSKPSWVIFHTNFVFDLSQRCPLLNNSVLNGKAVNLRSS